jgi:pimeloyl-ACP methyl ester carboxylesterase
MGQVSRAAARARRIGARASGILGRLRRFFRSHPVRMLAAILALVVLVYAGLCIALYAGQRALIYYPQPRVLGTQALEAFRRGDTLLQLTVRPRPGPGAVLYFGGNAEDVSTSLGPLVAAFPDRELVLLHYRGYGGSGGQPSEEAFAEDAAALFDRVHAAHPDVVVVGRSLGSGVAVRLASTRPVARLVLVTPYDSLMAIAQARFRAFPVGLLLKDRYESWRYAPQVSAPVLIVAAEHDEVIPAASSARLATRFAPGQARVVVLAGAGHNTIADDPAYARTLASAPEATR